MDNKLTINILMNMFGQKEIFTIHPISYSKKELDERDIELIRTPLIHEYDSYVNNQNVIVITQYKNEAEYRSRDIFDLALKISKLVELIEGK